MWWLQWFNEKAMNFNNVEIGFGKENCYIIIHFTHMSKNEVIYMLIKTGLSEKNHYKVIIFTVYKR